MGALLLGFLLFCVLFSLLFGPGCWASCCSFFSAGFFGCSFAWVSFVLRAFFVTFWPWVLGVVLLFFLGGLFWVLFCLGFFCFAGFFRYFLALGAGRRAALFSRRAFLGALLLGFLLFCWLFSLLFGPGCWASCCSPRPRAGPFFLGGLF